VDRHRHRPRRTAHSLGETALCWSVERACPAAPRTSPCIGETDQDSSLVKELPRRAGRRAPCDYKEILSWMFAAHPGYPLLTVVERILGFPYRWRPLTGCTHHGDAATADPRLRCRPVREIPIYDQLRGERINADVPASGDDSPRGAHPGKHRLLADASVPAAVFGPRDPGADRAASQAANQHDPVGVDPADQPPGDGQRVAAGRGPRAALPPPAHPRQAPPHAASSPPAPAASPTPADSAANASRPARTVRCWACATPSGGATRFTWGGFWNPIPVTPPGGGARRWSCPAACP
jgi:hypothetical protein